MSAIHKLSTVYRSFDAIRIELRLSPKFTDVELSTFIMAFPAALIVASFD